MRLLLSFCHSAFETYAIQRQADREIRRLQFVFTEHMGLPSEADTQYKV